jgi:hypothetical protein
MPQGCLNTKLLGLSNCGRLSRRAHASDGAAVDFSLRNLVCQFSELPFWERNTGLLVDR